MYRAGCENKQEEGCVDDLCAPVKKKTLIKIVDKDGNDFCFNKTDDIDRKDSDLIVNFMNSWNYELLKILSPESKSQLLKHTQDILQKGMCNDKRAQRIIQVLDNSIDKSQELASSPSFEVLSIKDL